MLAKISAGTSTALKAIYAAAAAALAGLSTALVGAQTFSGISDAQWITIGSLTLAAFGAVYGVTNAPSRLRSGHVAKAPAAAPAPPA